MQEREARVAAEALVERMYTSVLQEAKEQTDEHRLRAAVRDMELRLRVSQSAARAAACGSALGQARERVVKVEGL